jgi:hypothetical protein
VLGAGLPIIISIAVMVVTLSSWNLGYAPKSMPERLVRPGTWATVPARTLH